MVYLDLHRKNIFTQKCKFDFILENQLIKFNIKD